MRTRIEHRVGIQTPPQAIWAVIADLPAWGKWNPLYPKAEGAIRIGERLTLELALPGRKPRTIRPTVLDWVPNEQLHWRLTGLGGLVKTTRYLEIEQLAETGCIFSNGEMFEGALGEHAARLMRKTLKAGFAALGEAVKVQAEARWRAEAGGPT